MVPEVDVSAHFKAMPASLREALMPFQREVRGLQGDYLFVRVYVYSACTQPSQEWVGWLFDDFV